jgi:ketosteroid isomerase-like protein
MSEEENARNARAFVDAFNKKDFEKALTYFVDDATLEDPRGTFKGKNEIRRVFMAETQFPDLKITDYGVGMLVKGNLGIYEFEEETTYQGKKISVHVASVAEMTDGKFQKMRNYYDRLSMAKQAVKGWMATRAVNSIINKMEEPYRQQART